MERLCVEQCPKTGVVHVWSPCGLEMYINRKPSGKLAGDPPYLVEVLMRAGAPADGEPAHYEFAYAQVGIGAQGPLEPTGVPSLAPADERGWAPPVLEAEIPVGEDPGKWVLGVAPGAYRNAHADLQLRHNPFAAPEGERAGEWEGVAEFQVTGNNMHQATVQWTVDGDETMRLSVPMEG